MLQDYISVLPHLNAILNASSAVLLTTGYFFIRRKRISAHRNCQLAALVASVVFLVSYLVYHSYHGVTRFAGQGIVRPVYFTILISHTTLAILIVPFVFATLNRAARGQFAKHRRLARRVFPAWLYVSVTGVVVYWMLYHVYPSP